MLLFIVKSSLQCATEIINLIDCDMVTQVRSSIFLGGKPRPHA